MRWLPALVLALVCVARAQVSRPPSASNSPGLEAYKKADALFVAKRFPECLAEIEEALRLDPKLVPALTLRAKLAMTIYRFDVATESLERALAVEPGSAYVYFLYGLDAYLTNDLQLALPRFEKARKLNPADPRAALYLGMTEESLGRSDDAMKLYEEAVRLEEAAGAPQADTLLAGVRLLFLMGRFSDCEQWLAKAIKIDPNSRPVRFELARLLLNRDEAAQAAKEGEKALTLPGGDPTDTQIHYLLVRAYTQANQPEQAKLHADAVRAK